MYARQQRCGHGARIDAVDRLDPCAGEIAGGATQRLRNAQFALGRCGQLEWKEYSAGREVRARLRAPVDESHEQVAVAEQGVQRGEEAPGRVAIERRRADLPLEVAQGFHDFLRIGGVREVRRHVAKRRCERRDVGSQLFRRERGWCGGRGLDRECRQHHQESDAVN